MAATTFSTVIENADEQILSNDLNRMQAIASRDAQNVLMNGSTRDAFTNQADGTPLAEGTQDGSFVDRADRLGTIQGNTGSFVVNMGDGQVFSYLPVGLSDASDYQVVRWPAQTIATITPDASQVRVDLIYATPAMVPTDLQSRNILVDPVARTVSPNNVNKTNNSLATIGVQTGVPGTASAPLAPSGSVALWEVVNHHGDADSTSYRFVPRLWKRVESFGTCHAILENCVPTMPLTVESGSYVPTFGIGRVHRAIIDGEVVVSSLYADTIAANPDTNNNPLTASVDVNKDVFCYLYLCGGRHAPQNGVAGIGVGNSTGQALQLVASLTPPLFNRASAALAINGVQVSRDGTLYAGFWAIAKNTHHYKSCVISGDWLHARTNVGYLTSGFNESIPSPGITGTADIHPPLDGVGNPVPTTVDLVVAVSDATTYGNTVNLGASHTFNNQFVVLQTTLSTQSAVYLSRARMALGTGQFNWNNGPSSSTYVIPFASGYNMNVPRIG